MTDPSPIVELRDVTRVYQQGSVEVPALRGLSMTVAQGEFTTLCGPSGSGKTTTLNLIGALDREKQTAKDAFAKTFTAYASPANKTSFRELFTSK